MSYTFSRRDFLKYSALTAVAVAGAGLLTGCEIQDPNNPVIKKLGYGTTLGTTGGLLESVDTEGTDGVFTFTVKNNSDASLRMDPNESFVVKVLDKDGNSRWNNLFNLSIAAVPGKDGNVPDILPGLWVSTKSVCPSTPLPLPSLRRPWSSPSFLSRPSLLNSA